MRETTIEREKTRTEVAAFLREFATELEKGQRVTMIIGNESTTLNPPDTVHFKFDSDVDSSWIGHDEGRSLRFELGWQMEDEPVNDEISVVRSDDIGQRSRRPTEGEPQVERADQEPP